MKDYELVVIYDSSLEEGVLEKEISKLTETLQKDGCEITNVDKWGVRKLAYPIKKQENGYYVIIYFKGEGKVVPEVDRINKINDNVVFAIEVII